MRLVEIINVAVESLSSRQIYAKAVIRGHQLWSGADLHGKAKRFGGTYARQRGKAHAALRAAGGYIIPTEKGLLRTARIIGMDDYGNLIAETARGIAVPGRVNWRHV